MNIFLALTLFESFTKYWPGPGVNRADLIESSMMVNLLAFKNFTFFSQCFLKFSLYSSLYVLGSGDLDICGLALLALGKLNAF